MARTPKPWFRKDRKCWFVTINGKRHNLGHDKKQAHKRFHELMREPKQAVPIAKSAASLPSVVDAFLDWALRNRAPATFEWYRERLQSFVTTYGDLDIELIRPFHVETWAANGKRAVNTRRNLMRSVKRCLRWACSQGHIEKNPIEQLEIPTAESKEVYVPPEQFENLLEFLTDPSFAELMRITYETGCRPQELLKVEARHVDLENQRWVFPARESKGKSMPRIVYLSTHAVAVCKEQMNLYPTGALFRNTNGKPWNKSSVGCTFDRLQIAMGKEELCRIGDEIPDAEISDFIKSLKPSRQSRGVEIAKSQADLRCEAKRKLTHRRARQLGFRCSLYALRHSWATNALKSGVDALTVAVLMGHKDPSTLARTYQHLSHNPEHMLRQARKAAA